MPQLNTPSFMPWTVFGYRADGRPIYGFAGGAPDDGGDPVDDGAADGGDSADADEALGDAGKRALDAERAKARAEKAAAAPWKALAKEFNLTPEQAREALAKASGVDDATATARREAAAEAMSKANQRIVRSEVKALAASDFADPADALPFLDLTSYEVDDDGEIVDPKQIREDLKALLERKPYLKKAGTRVTPKPDPSQGGGKKPLSGKDAGLAEAQRRFNLPAVKS